MELSEIYNCKIVAIFWQFFMAWKFEPETEIFRFLTSVANFCRFYEL